MFNLESALIHIPTTYHCCDCIISSGGMIASVSCDINNVTGIESIFETCSAKITTIATKVKDTCMNKPRLPTDVFEFINNPISCITTTDIDYVEGSNSYSLRDIVKCSTLPYENIPLLDSLEMKIQIIHMCQETLRHLAIWLPLLFWTNISTPSELLTQKIIVIWILWSSYSFLRANSHNFQFNSSTDVPYPNFYLK